MHPFLNVPCHVSRQVHVICTVHTATGICHTVFAEQNLYDTYLLLCIQYYTPDDGQETSSKQVEFYSKNKFEKLFHLAGFIIRMLEPKQYLVQ